MLDWFTLLSESCFAVGVGSDGKTSWFCGEVLKEQRCENWDDFRLINDCDFGGVLVV